jgi:hypothetical protein
MSHLSQEGDHERHQDIGRDALRSIALGIWGIGQKWTPLYDQVQATSQSYILRSIMEFSSDLTVGTRNVPVVAVLYDPRPMIPSYGDRKSPVPPAPGASFNPGASPGKSPETVRPAPVPPPAEGFGDLIEPGGFVRPPPGYDKWIRIRK